MNNILSDFEHVLFCAVHIFEYIVCRVMYTGSRFKIYVYGIQYIPNEGLEFRVQCMICFMLMQNAV